MRRGVRKARRVGTFLCSSLILFILLSKTAHKTSSQTHSKFCEREWLGSFGKNAGSKHCVYHAAISHCRSDLSWFEQELRQVRCELKSVTIYSKCDVEPYVNFSLDFASNVELSLVKLANVGRCDHTYAYHMAQISLDGQVKADEVVLFLKDTRDVHQPGYRRDLSEVVQISRGPARFCCGLVPAAEHGFKFANISIWHSTKQLSKFKIHRYTRGAYRDSNQNAPVDFRFPYGNFQAWSENLGIHLRTRKVTPVCYGGTFATVGQQIYTRGTAFWLGIVHSLERGNSIEEGHFMERVWAHTLLHRTDQLSDEVILRHAQHTITRDYRGLQGTLYGCRQAN